MTSMTEPYALLKDRDSYCYVDNVEKVGVSFSHEMKPNLIILPEPNKILSEEEIIDQYVSFDEENGLSSLLQGKKNVVIIISDQTRNVPSEVVLPLILSDVEKAGIPFCDVRIIVALGVHRPLNKEELKKLVGDEIFEKVSVVNHEAMNKEKLEYLGDSSSGTPIFVNKYVVQADFCITIGKVEPHEFAGFTGGRKSILPGVAGEETIKINHRPEMVLDGKSVPGSLDDNKIHKDMVEAAEYAKVDYCISFVLNKNNQILKMCMGDFRSSHEKAVDFYRSFAELKLESSPDIVITTPGAPLNVDFYQSIKPLITLEQIVEAGKVIILYSGCPEGVNSVDLLRPFEAYQSIDEIVAFINENYQIQMDHALYLSRVLKKGIKIIAVCPTISDEILEMMHLTPARSVGDAIEKAKTILGKRSPSTLIFPQPQRSLPVIRND